MKPKSFNLGED